MLMGSKSLYGVLRLVVQNTEGEVIAEGFITSSELTHDPNPDFTVTIDPE
nr:hypothetical protein 25 [bacterium]